MEEMTLPKVDAPIAVESDSDELDTFAKSSMQTIRSEIEQNRQDAKFHTDVEKSVEDVLSPDNIRELDIRARPLENPKVTLWLRDCPIWANHAWNQTIRPFGRDKYNGKVKISFDVRPF